VKQEPTSVEGGKLSNQKGKRGKEEVHRWGSEGA